MKRYIFIFCLTIYHIPLKVYSQFEANQDWILIEPDTCSIPIEDRPVIDIQEILLKDSILLKNIEIMIIELNDKDSLFKSGLGYFVVMPYRPYWNKEIIQQYYLTYDFYSLKTFDTDYAYPPFYSIANDRLIFVDPYALKKMTSTAFPKKAKRS